jgi:ribosomal protein S18 acetylase RimI-like enzyme
MLQSAVRAAKASDYPAFERLFPELGVHEPLMPPARFETELVPTTLVAEAAGAHVVGYTYFQVMGTMAYVRHLVVAPAARRQGIARLLMHEVVARVRALGCVSFCLNVKPDNVAAIALYEDFGLARAYESVALQIDWEAVRRASLSGVDGHAHASVHAAALAAAPAVGIESEVSVREILPADDATVEPAMRLVRGQLEAARALPKRVLLMLEEGLGAIAGAAVFHPQFPGASPFRVARAALAIPLLSEIATYADPADLHTNLMVEGQPEVAAYLEQRGARVQLRVAHMVGTLPAQ